MHVAQAAAVATGSPDCNSREGHSACLPCSLPALFSTAVATDGCSCFAFMQLQKEHRQRWAFSGRVPLQLQLQHPKRHNRLAGQLELEVRLAAALQNV
jgi:hypothetical protein